MKSVTIVALMLAMLVPVFPQIDPLLLIDDMEKQEVEADNQSANEDVLYFETMLEYRAAAEQNDPEAQYVLGTVSEKEPGLRRNYIQAYFWYTLAAEQSHEGAAEALDRVAKKMTAEQIARAAWLVEEWKRSKEAP